MKARFHVWKPQHREIANFARANREAMLSAGEWDGTGEPPRSDETPATVVAVLESAFRRWMLNGCPRLDYGGFSGLPASGWVPTARDSTTVTVTTDEPTVATAARTVAEMRDWVNTGRPAKNMVPARVTLAVVDEYMREKQTVHHDDWDYTGDIDQ